MNDRSGCVSGSSFRPCSNGFGGIMCGACHPVFGRRHCAKAGCAEEALS
jgi:hypothetical protein